MASHTGQIGGVTDAMARRGAGFDYMSRGYSQIREPLSLAGGPGEQWLSEIYLGVCGSASSTGLVLGTTPWIGDLLRQTLGRVIMADLSPGMIEMARAYIAESRLPGIASQVEFINSNWLSLPDAVKHVDTVVGDNSFSFMPYPDGWLRLCDAVAERMESGAALVVRLCSAPATHERIGTQRLVSRYLTRPAVNYTEVRTSLLFEHWEPLSCAIDTEKVAERFELDREEFELLYEKFPAAPDNDLAAVKKYRNSGAVYYAPPLDKALAALSTRFRITSVHYGPYALAEYFPLVVGIRK